MAIDQPQTPTPTRPPPGTHDGTAPVPPAFETLYREHCQFVARAARRLNAPEGQIEDVVQDVFIVVGRRLHEFEGRASIKTWLFAITVRVVAVHRRTEARHKRRIGALAMWLSQGVGHGSLSDRESAHNLQTMLARLDERRRAVFILVELEGATAKEVAAELNLPVSTVNTCLKTARRRLAKAADEIRNEIGAPQ